jgi:hypothetical protein
MMVKPMLVGDQHVQMIRTMSQEGWRATFESAEYSKEIKNQLYRLMSIQEVDFESTAELLVQAKKGFKRFRKNTPEGRDMHTIENILNAEARKRKLDKGFAQDRIDHVQEVLKRQDEDETQLTKDQKWMMDEMDRFVDSVKQTQA